MKFEATRIPDVYLLTPQVYYDDRGYFLETHRTADFPRTGAPIEFVQGNVSRSRPHTIRGLHYQRQEPQGKLVRCLQGSIFDVAVDMRRGSPTLGQWVSATLSEQNGQALWVPAGFAHGFLSGPEGALAQYECTTYYVDAWNHALRWDDIDINITWPLPMGMMPTISNKDRAAKGFRDAELFDVVDGVAK